MFEKIFGIFRKKKSTEFSAEMPGDTDDDMFDMGDTGMEDDFDADTISLETGMSDGGFSGSSSEGGMADSDPQFGDTFGDLDTGGGMGVPGLDLDEESEPGLGGLEEPITPPPEIEQPVEEDLYAAPAPKGRKKGLLVTVAVVVVAMIVGFFLATPASIEMISRAISSEPTVQEQLETLVVENAGLDKNLKAYRSVGTMEEILVIKAEIKKRGEMSAEIERIEAKTADRPAVEERLDRVDVRLDQAKRGLIIQRGTLANVQKSLKQIEARSTYLISSTRLHLEQIEEASAKSEELKARLDDKRIEKAEAEAMASSYIQQGVIQTAFEALSPL